MHSADAPQIIEHACLPLSFSPHDVKWVPRAARFVALGATSRATGALHVFELTPSATRLVAAAEVPAALRCASFGASPAAGARQLAAGDAGGRLAVWELERLPGVRAGAPAPSATAATAAAAPPLFCAPAAHAGMVNALDGVGGLGVGGGAPELASGGRDGRVCVWDTRVAGAVAAFAPAAGAAARECWAVAFGDSVGDERALAAGYDNGDVKLFDLRAQRVRWQANAGNGVTALEFDRKDIAMNKLVVTALESAFRVYDMRSGGSGGSGGRLPPPPQQSGGVGGGGSLAYTEERAHKATVWLAKHTPQNRDLWATAGGNGGINIYKYHYPAKRTGGAGEGVGQSRQQAPAPEDGGRIELLNARILSPQPIAALDWHAEREGLACAVSLDMTARVLLVTKLDKY